MHFGQNSLSSKSEELNAFEQFQKGLYHDVIGTLRGNEDKLNPSQEILFLLSKLKIGKPDNEGIKSWISNNDDHPFKSLALFNYGQLRFQLGDSLASKKFLSTIRSSELAQRDRANYFFMRGVLSLNDKNYSAAQDFFKNAASNEYEDQDQLIYYQAFTNYHLNDYQQAADGFTVTRQHSAYSISSNYFLAKIYLEHEDFDEAIQLAQGELSEEESVTNSGLYQLLGEAYARKDQVEKADAFFEKAIEVHPGRPSPDLYYQAGVSKFKIGNEDKALAYLTDAGIGRGSLAKLSAFQLGRLYIRRNQPEMALSAYMEASSAEDRSIQEESIYQSAKLNAKLQRIPESIRYSKDYLDRFPNGKWSLEIEDLLASSYLKTSDYEEAMKQLELRGLTNETQKRVYQKVSFQQGLQSFNDGGFNEAIPLFKKSLTYPFESDLENEAHYYLGEIYLQRESYQNAIASYRKMDPISAEGNYGVGFALYNQRKYSEAISFLQRATKSEISEIAQDAQLRLADCYYATKQYTEALKLYSGLPQVDYVLFQEAMVLRNLDLNVEAAASLNKIAAGSSFGDDALFYQGQIYFENSEFEKAAETYSSLLQNFPSTTYLSKLYLNRGISYSNLSMFEQAKADYDFLLQNHLQSNEAFNAILGLQDLEQKGVDPGNISRYIKEYKKANPGDGSLEIVEFEEAKNSYFDLDYERAAEGMQGFLKAYPESKFRAEAVYYLGDAYYRTKQLEASRKVFDNQRFIRNEYTGRILNRLGNINLQLENFDRAIEDFELLLDLNLSEKDSYNARKGAMLACVELERYEQVISYADEIIFGDWKPLNAVPAAKVFKARALCATGQADSCTDLYQELAQGEDQYAAESAYALASLAYQTGNYDQSLDQLFEMTSRLGSYTQWIEKAYLLIADNYISKDELFQAKATLRSIIQHSQNPDTRTIAIVKLESIEQSDLLDSLNQGNR